MALAKLPKPPRVVSVEPDAVDVAEDEAESPPKKLVRRDHDPPWPLLPEEVRDAQAVAASGDDGAVIPGLFGAQFSRGINA